MPEYQHLEPGEFFAFSRRGNGLRVQDVQPGHAIVLQWHPGFATWTFELSPDGMNGTRLISRNRIYGKGFGFVVGMALMEPLSLIMERKMLIGINYTQKQWSRNFPGDLKRVEWHACAALECGTQVDMG